MWYLSLIDYSQLTTYYIRMKNCTCNVHIIYSRSLTKSAFNAASEHMAWLLYYAIPTLSGVLPKPYHEHLELLVCSIHILLGDGITAADLSLVEQMLEKFCKEYELLYGN